MAREPDQAGAAAAAPEPEHNDLTAAPEAVVAELPPEVVAQSLGEYARAYASRIRAGESGVLPVILALVIIMVVFQAISPNHVFLSAGNLVNLFQQSAVFMVLAMAESFALILGEIDLSIGFVGAMGAAITVQLVQPQTTNWAWGAAIVAGLAACAVFGLIQGVLITQLRLPSFIVTLGGYLIADGLFLLILLLGPFSGYPSLAGLGDNLHVVYNLMWGTLDTTVTWAVAAAVVAGLGGYMWLGDHRRRSSGLVAPPVSLTIIKIAMIAVVAVVVVLICNTNRANLGTLEGMPWVIPIVLVVLGAWTVLLQRSVRPLRGGGGGHRRHQPLRRPGQAAPWRAGRPRHRRHLQRHVPPGPAGPVGVHRDRAGAARGHHHRLRLPPRLALGERWPGLAQPLPRAAGTGKGNEI